MAALQKFKLLATQCGAAQSPTRSPRTSPVVHLRRRKTTLRMLLSLSTGRRSPRRRETPSYQLLPEKRNEDGVGGEKASAPPRSSLKDLFVSSPPFQVEGGRRNFEERSGVGGENSVVGLVSKGIGGGSTFWQPGSPRPGFTGLRYKSLLRRSWRPVLVAIPES